MVLDPDACYRALRARDPRFDGLFYVGVETTGIYCRPICPARTPARARCTFHAHAAAAERAGYRACLRCRPELAPGHASVDARSRLVTRASQAIAAGYLDTHTVEALAKELDVSARHLRRSLEAELGVSPHELAASRRLALAKRLLQDTGLPMTRVAFASGYSSLRRFNAAIRARFDRTPSELRGRAARDRAALRLRLDYRAPFDWDAMLAYLAPRATAGVEEVAADRYRRVVEIDAHRGWVELAPAPRSDRLVATASLELTPVLAPLVARLRALFDLDAQPAAVHAALGDDPRLAASFARRPGLRVLGAFDRFESAARIVLGQQVSVAAATTLAGRIAARWGTPIPDAPGALAYTFPRAARLARVRSSSLQRLGLTRRRADTLRALAREVDRGRLRLDGALEPTLAALGELHGVGPWTQQMIAMRVLAWPDAFPAGDLVLRRALDADNTRACAEASTRWRPWRAYAAAHLWAEAQSPSNEEPPS